MSLYGWNMRVLVTGASGFVGSLLCLTLLQHGHQVFALSRNTDVLNAKRTPRFSAYTYGDPLPDTDAIVNLAGESIARKRLNQKRSDEIVESRIAVMKTLRNSYQNRMPEVVIEASASGIYPEGRRCDENSPISESFIATMIKRIEEAAHSYFGETRRLVIARFGVIMGEGGGLMALTALLPRIVLLGGSPSVPWTGCKDAVRALEFILSHDALEGIVNITDPRPASAAALLSKNRRSRPPLPVPAFCLSFLFDHRCDLITINHMVFPKKLTDNGFIFEEH